LWWWCVCCYLLGSALNKWWYGVVVHLLLPLFPFPLPICFYLWWKLLIHFISFIHWWCITIHLLCDDLLLLHSLGIVLPVFHCHCSLVFCIWLLHLQALVARLEVTGIGDLHCSSVHWPVICCYRTMLLYFVCVVKSFYWRLIVGLCLLLGDGLHDGGTFVLGVWEAGTAHAALYHCCYWWLLDDLIVIYWYSVDTVIRWLIVMIPVL
jgi:hypothetical protein